MKGLKTGVQLTPEYGVQWTPENGVQRKSELGVQRHRNFQLKACLTIFFWGWVYEVI